MRDLDISKFPAHWRQSIRNPDVCLRDDGYSVCWEHHAEAWFPLDTRDELLGEEDGVQGGDDDEGAFDTADEAIAAVDAAFPVGALVVMAVAGTCFRASTRHVHAVWDTREAIGACGTPWPSTILGRYDLLGAGAKPDEPVTCPSCKKWLRAGAPTPAECAAMLADRNRSVGDAPVGRAE